MAKSSVKSRRPAGKPVVGVIMGSQSDWAIMRHTTETLGALGIPHEALIISAHRTPKRLDSYASGAMGRGLKIIVAAAGGAAHLAGVTAALTPLPVLGVPMQGASLGGLDSLLSMVQMPAGVPVGTLAIGRAGAVNAALIAAGVLALSDPSLSDRLEAWRRRQTEGVADVPSNEGGA
jgi:5-(carboxyamino)imidazole ribonucleotide mutase